MSTVGRRGFLAGASAITVCLYMPGPSTAPALNHEALMFVAERVRRALSWWDQGTRRELYNHAFRYAQHIELGTDVSNDQRLLATTNRLLRSSFRSLKMEAQEGGLNTLIHKNGTLTPYGQKVVMGLPLAPEDMFPPELFDALGKLAPHYLA